ncbi:hypothetical protein F511_37172 [Dorcoceras hygrometricum]|uniref:Uncharacterized protein n=1 Tax=Dorcoceras hygrometricum TaxID=472368 RepID=A0A2Z7DBT5_9LAMI|nr:hypothetical protein F511_37172 [Dorcoceras hygrometricum]
MAAYFFVNALQFNFESVLIMEHTGMEHMFKSLEDTGLTVFLAASSSVYESAVVEIFANAKVTAETIVSFVANRKLALMKETFAEAFGLPTEMTSFLDIPNQNVIEMRGRFSGSDVPFRTPSKKKKIKIEFHLLHDIVAKALCAKAGSFDMVTTEKFDLMVAITARLKVNWAQVLLQVLVAMVHDPSRQSQGFSVQLSVLLERLVKTDLGESVKLRPKKVLTNKSVHTYIKKNLDVRPAGESSKKIEDTTSGTEGGQSHMTKPVEKKKRKTEKGDLEKPKKNKDKVRVTKKHRTKRTKRATHTNDQAESQPNPISDIPAGGDRASTIGGPKENPEKNPAMETRAGDESTSSGLEGHLGTTPKIEGVVDDATSNVDEQEEHMECEHHTKTEGQDGNVSTVAQGDQEKSTGGGPKGAIVVRSGPEQPAQQSMTFTGTGIFTPMEIPEINWAMYFLPKINLIAMGWLLLTNGYTSRSGKNQRCFYFERLTQIEEQFLFWGEMEQVSELFERRSLILYNIYEMEVQKRVDEHQEKFKPAEAYVNYDYMCIQFLSRELKEIARQHRDLRALAGLPLVAPKASSAGDDASIDIPHITLSQPACSQILIFEFATQAEQEQAAEKKAAPAQKTDEEHIEEVDRTIENVETLEEEEDQPQRSSTHSDSSFGPYSSPDPSLSLSPSLNLGPNPSNFQMVVHIENREENQCPDHKDDEGSSQTSPQQVQSIDSKFISLDSKVEQLLNNQTFLKHDFNTYKRAFYEKIDMVAANVSSSQTSLETRLVRQFSEHQLQIASDLDSVKLQLAEMVNHLKEIGDSKKGDGGQSSGPRGGPSSGPSNRKGEGSSGYKR